MGGARPRGPKAGCVGADGAGAGTRHGGGRGSRVHARSDGEDHEPDREAQAPRRGVSRGSRRLDERARGARRQRCGGRRGRRRTHTVVLPTFPQQVLQDPAQAPLLRQQTVPEGTLHRRALQRRHRQRTVTRHSGGGFACVGAPSKSTRPTIAMANFTGRPQGGHLVGGQVAHPARAEGRGGAHVTRGITPLHRFAQGPGVPPVNQDWAAARGP
jgi:hypothetical protein